MSELKPCPFCGGEASYGTKYAHCLRCEDRFHVIDAWNTRPIEDQLHSEIEVKTSYADELEQMNKTLQDGIQMLRTELAEANRKIEIAVEGLHQLEHGTALTREEFEERRVRIKCECANELDTLNVIARETLAKLKGQEE